MAILLTGGAGFIGTHTIVELLKDNKEVVVVDNLVNSHEEAIKRVKAITGKDFVFYKADVRDEKAMDKIFNENEIECVIHFAGLKAVGESVSLPLEYYSNNIGSTLSLCKVMKKHKVKNIVFSSSATVYSGDNEMPLTETSKVGNCTNPYGWSKYMQEIILKDLAFSDDNWSVVLLRYFNPVGAHESGRIGEDPQGIPNNLLPYISQVAVGKLKSLKVFGNDYPTKDGTGVRDYIHVVDLARSHVYAVNYALKNKGSEVFNIGTGKGSSVLDMVNAFEKASGNKIPYVFAKRRPGDLATVYSQTSKAEKILGFKTEKDIDDMCRDSWKWQSNNPNGYIK